MDTLRYVAGCEITYETFLGQQRTCRVEAVHADIKGGRPGFDGTIIDGPDAGRTVWGYDDQIVDVRMEGGA